MVATTRSKRASQAKDAASKKPLKASSTSDKPSHKLPGTSPLNEIQVISAIRALIKYHRRHTKKVRKKRQLLASDEANAPETTDEGSLISIQISLKKVPKTSPHKGVCIQVPHGLWKEAEVLLIVADDAVGIVKGDIGVGKVVGCSKVKVMGVKEVMMEYSTHERRRELLGMYDVFLCDDRLLPMMPRVLGNAFFKRKGKLPRVVDLGADDVKEEIGKVVGCVVGRWGKGTCVDVIVGRMGWKIEWLVQNFEKVVEKVVGCFDGGWKSVLSVGIKCRELKGVCLPVWNSLPEVGDYGGVEEEGNADSKRDQDESSSEDDEENQPNEGEEGDEEDMEDMEGEQDMEDEQETRDTKDDAETETTPRTRSKKNTAKKSKETNSRKRKLAESEKKTKSGSKIERKKRKR